MGRPAIDETGNRYGRLTVIRRATSEEYEQRAGLHATWLCKCDCGNEVFVQGSGLRNGKQKSCGCQNRETARKLMYNLGKVRRLQLIGQRFGLLTVIEEDDMSKHNGGGTYWKCKCDCGAITIVRGQYLINGHTRSCGCIRNVNNNKLSLGEERITQILMKNHLIFKHEYSFNDLHSSRGGLMRFDFAVFDNAQNLQYLIEFDGQQHMEQVEYFQKHRTDFQNTQAHDRKKNSYCLAHNILLYRIPFWELDEITTLDNILDKKHLVKNRYHNDDLWEQYCKEH